MNRLAAIVIVNWNGYPDTRQCLESLKEVAYEKYFVIIVDNASSDLSEAKLRQEFPEHTILQSGANLGFAGGANVGIRHALGNGADYVLLLNNDTQVDSQLLTRLVQTIERREDIGLAGPMVKYMSQPDKVWAYGGAFNANTGSALHFLNESEHQRFVMQPPWYLYVPACVLLIKRTCIEGVGLFSERYFHLAEDLDYCIRAQQKGWSIALDPGVTVLHKGSASLARFSPLYNYYEQRNRLFVIQQYRTKRKTLWLNLRDGFMIGARLLSTVLTIDKPGNLPRGMRLLAWSVYDFYFGRDGKREDGTGDHAVSGLSQRRTRGRKGHL
jgi:hypothetical protein